MDLLERLTRGQRTALRLLAGPLLAAAALVIAFRMGIADTWTHFPRFLVLFATAGFLYALAMGWFELPAAAEEQGVESVWWRVAYVVVALILLPPAFMQLVASVDGEPTKGFNLAWYFAVGAGAAWGAAARLRLPFTAFAGGLLVVAAWSAFWADALEEPDLDSFRWILLVAAIALGYCAFRLWEARAPEVGDLVTAAGLAGVVAGAIGSASQPFPTVFFAPVSLLGGQADVGRTETDGWQLYLLVVGLTLIWLASRLSRRGPGYMGAFALVIFVATAASEVVLPPPGPFPALQEGPRVTLAGWPLILLFLAAAAILAGWLRRPAGAPPPPSESAAPRAPG